MSLTKAKIRMIDGIGINVVDFGADRTGATDSSAAFTAALDYVIAEGGGRIFIPKGTYQINVDWSSQVIAGGYGQIIFEGESSTSVKLLGVTGASALLTIDRGGSGDNMIGSNMVFKNMEFRTEDNICSGGTPVINHAVYIDRTSAEFFNVIFSGGSRSAFYGENCQYTKFIDCMFRCASIAPTTYPSAGAWIRSAYNETVADQITIDRCIFNSSQNGLYCEGVFQLRVLNSRFQQHFNAGEGAIVIKDTLDSAGSENIHIMNCHFELNYVRDIYMPSQTNRTLVQSCAFFNQIGQWPTKVAVCEQASIDMTYIGNDFRTADGPTLTLLGNNGSLTYLGNDEDPYSLTLSGSNNSGMVYSGSKSSGGGQLDMLYTQMNLSAYYGRAGLHLDGYQLWVDSSGRLRIKSGAPTSDTDGTVVGTQT